MLNGVNSLLVAEEILQQIAREANIGQVDLPEGAHWPLLDFGCSLIVKRAAKELEQHKAGIDPTTASKTDEVSEERKNPGYNDGGRPAESSMLTDHKPTGQVKISSFTVDSFDPSLDNFNVIPTKAPTPLPMPTDYRLNRWKRRRLKRRVMACLHLMMIHLLP